MLRDVGFEDGIVNMFSDDVVSVLNDYAELIGEGTEIRYSLAKKLGKIELKVLIPGEAYDPFKNGSEAKDRTLKNIVTINLNTSTVSVSYKYLLGHNAISVTIPLTEKKRSLIKDPMVLAILLGLILGFLCRYLPGGVSAFILDDLASPLQSIILKIISGIMGPVIFISMTTSIIALESVNIARMSVTHLPDFEQFKIS